MIYYWLTFAAVIVGAYCIGNVNFSIIISRLIAHRDIRQEGSGNPGTMNVLRNMGKPLGALTLVLDVLKGALPALLGWLILGPDDAGEWAPWRFSPDMLGAATAGLAAVVGHIYPLAYRFKGGKGVASALGVALVANCGGMFWWVTFAAFLIGVVYLYFGQYGFIASLVITGIPLGFAAVMSFVGGYIASGVLLLALYALILFAHRGNMSRFANGKEAKTVIFGQDKRKAKRAAQTESPKADAASADEKNMPDEKTDQ
ncbi:MAG: glycerol-3-phosphate acyltransferase [Clostridiales bacterium]|jgi:glycerol-3-phosphate acyltransferase PlsY|nr:glycerol-3-phosphate acyltransferase [Clostridiales bacterium]